MRSSISCPCKKYWALPVFRLYSSLFEVGDSRKLRYMQSCASHHGAPCTTVFECSLCRFQSWEALEKAAGGGNIMRWKYNEMSRSIKIQTCIMDPRQRCQSTGARSKSATAPLERPGVSNCGRQLVELIEAVMLPRMMPRIMGFMRCPSD